MKTNKNITSIIRNIVRTFILLFIATLLSFVYNKCANNYNNISTLFTLAVLLISLCTDGYIYGIIASFLSILCINYLFTYPYFHLNFVVTGYPLTFLMMLIISIITSTTTAHLRDQAKVIRKHEEVLVLAEKEKTRATLLRAISHDIRTPLTSIIGASDIYLQDDNSLSEEDKRRMVGNIREDAGWLITMIENILSVTRIDESTAKVTKEEQPLEEVVTSAIGRIRRRIPSIRIKVNMPDDLIMVPMDPILIEQVIINLLENAYKHSGSKEPIDIEITTDDKNVYFSVKDYGKGIDQHKLDTIFDGNPSYSYDKADSSKGIGIGLSICKTIIEAHGGHISAHNNTVGAEFTFTLAKEN